MNALRHFLLALQFFTRIPVTGSLARWVDYTPQRLCASAGHFPGVGVLVGGAAALVHAVAAWSLPPVVWTPLVAAVLSTVASAWLTGAFHEDGLADVADALGGPSDRDGALQIMKDSRIGAFGALTLLLAVATKLSLLALLGALQWQLACSALVLAHVVSRAWPLAIIRLLPHIGDSVRSKSRPLAERIDRLALGTAGLWVLLALAILAWGGAVRPHALAAAALASATAFVWCWRLFRRRLAGFTGDCLGATQQACELACYLGLAVAS